MTLTGIWEAIFASAADAFVEVGVFVGAVLLFFQYVNYRQHGGLVTRIEQARGYQPLVGALLGLTPGCGGAIFVMTLYLRGSVTFGTVIATLVSTMGDAAFVMLAAAPIHFVWVSLASFVIALLVGYLIDGLGVPQRLGLVIAATGNGGNHGGGKGSANANGLTPTQRHLREKHPGLEPATAVAAAAPGDWPDGHGVVHDSAQLHHFGHREGDAMDIALHHRRGTDEHSLGYRLTHRGFLVYWAVIAVGLLFGIAGIIGYDLGELIGIPWVTAAFGALGTTYGIVVSIAAHRFGINTSHEDEEHKLFSLRETLIHGAMDTAFVTSWVFVSYVVYSLGVLWLGRGDMAAAEALIGGWLARTGVVTVILGSLLGLIPGCGPQILFISLFTRGLLPFAAVLANSISQDGDALFPLLAMNRRSALWATLITTIPALVFGLLFYFLETNSALGQLLRP